MENLSWSPVLALIAVLILPVTNLDAHNAASFAEKVATTESLMDSHLRDFRIAFPNRCSTRIKQLIREQLMSGRRETEGTIGRAAYYFPIFEHYLKQRNLPEELKYLPFVESRLKVSAKSPSGALGLWQFMDYTAAQYGLVINEQQDERLDPIRSTEAAASFLADLYEEFDDWLLALAAYNCGAGKVRAAMRQAKSKDYWAIEAYLPTQTQRYIPAFISAVYVVEHYQQHGLSVRTYRFSSDQLRLIKIKQSVHLRQVAKVARLPLHTMRQLNPGYRQEVIPASRRGNYLILPDSSFTQVIAMLNEKGIQAREIAITTRQVAPAQPHVEEAEAPVPEISRLSLGMKPQKSIFAKVAAFILHPLRRLFWRT